MQFDSSPARGLFFSGKDSISRGSCFYVLPLKVVERLFGSGSEEGGNNPVPSVQLSEAFLKACLSPLVDLDWEKIAFNGSAFGNHRLLPNLSVSLICPSH